MTVAFARPKVRLDARAWKAILALGVTQVIGWGSSFYLLAILGPPIRAELHLPPELIYGGVSITLALSGVLGPRFGRLLDERGCNRPMAVGSLVMASGLLLLSFATDALAYGLAWIVIGVATPLCLYQSAFTALTQIAGPSARRAITFLTFMGGLASTVFWPLSGALLETFGWRETCLIYALLNAGICAPLHLLALGRRKQTNALVPHDVHSEPRRAALPQHAHAAAALAFAGMLALNGFVFNGLSVHVLAIVQGVGFEAKTAIQVGMMIGVAQVLGRMGELALGDRYQPLTTAFVSSILLPIAFGWLLFGPTTLLVGLGYALTYGVSNGLLTIARGTVTLHLFGADGYGARLGRLTIGQSILGALAPIVFARVIEAGGASAGLWLAGATALAALAFLLHLLAIARRHGIR